MEKNSILYEKILGCLAAGVIGDAMGAPVENMNYQDIEKAYGTVCDFEGEGTDDSAIKLILCDAILHNGGMITADEFADSFLKLEKNYVHLFFIPVRNMLDKVKEGLVLPVYAGMGNMQSSSSAMSISPMGIINAGNPQRAAMETYDVAGLIHAGEATFCRDAACAMAASTAQAMKPGADVESVVKAATAYLHKKSSVVMRTCIEEALDYARECRDYKTFREWFYENKQRTVICDSRETVVVALALFYLAEGDPNQTILYAVNFGRDADTIGTMAGALAGAFAGAKAIRPDWFEKLQRNNDQSELAGQLYEVVLSRLKEEQEHCRQIEIMMEEART